MNVIRNNKSVKQTESEFVRSATPTTAWGNALSAFTMLPGLRAFWPMSVEGPVSVGANPGYVFVPAIGGNAGGFFQDHRDRLVYGGGPWQGGGTVEFRQAGIPMNYPFGSDDVDPPELIWNFIAYGIWTIPNGVTGFRATPICRILPRGTGIGDTTLELYTECMDVDQDDNWRMGNYLYGESSGYVPKLTTVSSIWNDTSSLTMSLNQAAWVNGEIYDALKPGLTVMFAAENFSWDTDEYGWFIGWWVEMYG